MQQVSFARFTMTFRLCLSLCMVGMVLVGGWQGARAQTPALEWAAAWDAIGFADKTQSVMALDNAGNVYVTGSFTGTVDFDPGSGEFNLTTSALNYRDVYVMKLNANGVFQWAVSFGGKGTDYAAGLDVNVDGDVFIAGRVESHVDFNPGPGDYTLQAIDSSQGDMFVCKLNALGQFVWAVRMGGSAATPHGVGVNSLALDDSSNVVVLGMYSDNVDFDPSASIYMLSHNITDGSLTNDYYILKLDANGAFRWARSLMKTEMSPTFNADAYPQRIRCGSDGSIIAVGGFEGTVDFNPGDASYALPSDGLTDGFIVKLDRDGNFGFARRLGGVLREGITDVYLGDNHVYLTGYVGSSSDLNPGAGSNVVMPLGLADAFVLKLDYEGEYAWSTHFGSISSPVSAAAGRCITLDNAGNVYVTGMFNDTVDLEPGPAVVRAAGQPNANPTSPGFTDMFLLSLDPNGDYRWSWAAGNSGAYEFLYGITVDFENSIILQGCFANTLDVDPCAAKTVNLESPSWTACFLLKLNQDGCPSDVASESTDNTLTLAPNPTNGRVTITSSFEFVHATVRIVSMLGVVVYESIADSTHQFVVDASAFASGTYFIEITNVDGTAHRSSMVVQ